MTVLALSGVLGLLSALHVYWAVGGRWGIAAAIPTDGGRPLFSPSPAATWAVAAALAIAAIVPLVRGGLVAVPVTPRVSAWASAVLAGVFFVRAVGDFRLVGFFKRGRGTAFAVRDTWLYSPLCLLLALGFVRIWLA